MEASVDRTKALLVGVDRSKTRWGVGAAIVLLGLGSAVGYLAIAGPRDSVFADISRTLLIVDIPGFGDRGQFVVLGLSLAYGYLNEGYAVSVLLGWSLVFGNVVWSVDRPTTGFVSISLTEPGLTPQLDPGLAFALTFPEAMVYGTAGFVAGAAFRQVRVRVVPGRSRDTEDPAGTGESRPPSDSAAAGTSTTVEPVLLTDRTPVDTDGGGDPAGAIRAADLDLEIGSPVAPDVDLGIGHYARADRYETSIGVNLNATAIGLGVDDVTYVPEAFPGLVYHHGGEQSGDAVIFPTGEVVLFTDPGTDTEALREGVESKLTDIGVTGG